MSITDDKPKLRRRVAIAGGAALLTAAGVGGYAALSAPTMHLVSASPTAPKPADTNTLNVQEGDQNAPDTAPGAPEAAGAEAPGAAAAPAVTEAPGAAEAPGTPEKTGASDGPGGPDTQQQGDFQGDN